MGKSRPLSVLNHREETTSAETAALQTVTSWTMTGPCAPELVSKDSCPNTTPTTALSPTGTPLESRSQPDPPEPIRAQPEPSPPSEGPGEKSSGQSQALKLLCGAEESRCGVCRHLALAFVLVVFSPLIAFGVCAADIVTGECCKVDDSEEDSKGED